MPNLYLAEQGAVLKKSSHSLKVEKQGKGIADVEVSRLENVLIYGNVQVTIQALRRLLNCGVPVSLLSEAGEYFGQLVPAWSGNVVLRQKQYELTNNPNKCFLQSRKLVNAKILNSSEVLRQFSWHIEGFTCDSELDELAKLAQKAETIPYTNALNGIEGAAAKIYFAAYARAFKDGTFFDGRSKRPPRDPANAIMSLCYVLLTTLISSHLQAIGLDPYFGFYHNISYNRPALALDILELFRAPVADRFAVKMLNLGVFKKEDFTDDAINGTRFSPEAIKRFFQRWDECLRKMELLSVIRAQAESVRRMILGEIEFPEYYQFKAK